MDWHGDIKRQGGGYSFILDTSWRVEVTNEVALVQSLYVLQTGTTH